jgi:hypothetical protein
MYLRLFVVMPITLDLQMIERTTFKSQRQLNQRFHCSEPDARRIQRQYLNSTAFGPAIFTLFCPSLVLGAVNVGSLQSGLLSGFAAVAVSMVLDLITIAWLVQAFCGPFITPKLLMQSNSVRTWPTELLLKDSIVAIRTALPSFVLATIAVVFIYTFAFDWRLDWLLN